MGGPTTSIERSRQAGAEIADLLARLDVAEAMAASTFQRERYLLLNHGLARRIVEAPRRMA